MKRIWTAIVLLISALNCLAQTDSITIKGVLQGQGNERVFLSFTGDDGKPMSYSATAINDGFTIRVKKLQQPTGARLGTSISRSLSKMENGHTVGNPAPSLDLFVYQSDLTIKGSVEWLQLASVQGDKENNTFAEYKSSVKDIEKRAWEIQKETFKLDYKKDSVAHERLLKETSGLFTKQKKLQKDFVAGHPSAYGSLFLLSRMENLYTAEQYEKAYNGLADTYKKTAIAGGITKKIASLHVTAAGSMAKNFSRTDKDGKVLQLSDLRGKVVLLDFWGSWCGPCRASHPHLKELYSKYKDKGFEILAVAQERGKTLEDSQATWLKAIKEDNINWVHVLNNEKKDGLDVVKAYNITGFPTKILIDKDGKILLRVTASATDDIDMMLKKKLGN